MNRLQPNSDDLLLVIDVQNDFCSGGALAVPAADEVIAPINRLAERFEHIVLTQDWHPADHHSFASQHPGHQPFETVTLGYGKQTLWPEHCVQGSPGAEFHPQLALTARAELILRKGYRRSIDSYSAFYENDRSTPTGLCGYLRERGIRRLFLAGLATDYELDAIALSTLRLFGNGKLGAEVAANAIGLAILSNLCFKTGLLAWVAGRDFLLRCLPGMMAIGIGIAIGMGWVGYA